MLLTRNQQFIVDAHDNFCGAKILIPQFFVTPLLKKICDLLTQFTTLVKRERMLEVFISRWGLIISDLKRNL